MNIQPVKVDIEIETTTLDREAFYNLCFITESDIAPRTLEVNTLRDLVENGYEREDLAYNFCVGVFAQQSMPVVYIRAKRSYETYEEAFSADNNDMYYYVVIESKDKEIVTQFNDFLITNDDYKLQFYSSNIPVVEGRKLVHYYLDDGDGGNFYINKTDLNNNQPADVQELNPVQLQQQRLAYPEAAWISACGIYFPSEVEWLHTYLSKVDEVKTSDILESSTASSRILKKRSTVGSGTTTQGIVISEQVSLDWIKWALGRKVWSTLYNSERLNGTLKNQEIIINNVKDVLNLALEEEMISEYEIKDVVYNRSSNNLSLKFSCSLVQTILFVNVSGSLYY